MANVFWTCEHCGEGHVWVWNAPDAEASMVGTIAMVCDRCGQTTQSRFVGNGRYEPEEDMKKSARIVVNPWVFGGDGDQTFKLVHQAARKSGKSLSKWALDILIEQAKRETES